MTQKQKWLMFCQWIRKTFPQEHFVKIRSVIASNNAGTTNFTNNVFHIYIAKNQCIDLKVDALMHEWAHCLTWFVNDDEHGARWGVIKAAIYQEHLKFKRLWKL